MTTDGTRRQPATPSPQTADDVAARVREALNHIHDPCGQAMGIPIGLADMGLVRSLEVRPHSHGWVVDLKLRLTAPGCTYYFYFEQQIRDRLARVPSIATLNVAYDAVADWTPEDMSEAARLRLQERRRRALIALEQRDAACEAQLRPSLPHPDATAPQPRRDPTTSPLT